MKSSGIIILFCLSVLFVPSSHAQCASEYMMPGYMGPMGMGGMGMGPMGMGHMGMGGMGSYAMMPGMMWQGPYGMLDLSDSQRQKLREIHSNLRKRHWGLMDKLMDYSEQLYKLYDVDKPDAQQIGNVYKNIFDIRRQMIESKITAKNQIYDILTKEQREKLKNWRSGMMGGGYGPGSHMGRGMHRMMME